MNKTLKIIICILCACILVTGSVLVYNKFFHKEEEVVENIPVEDDSKDIVEIDEEGITIVDNSEENVTDTKEDTNKGRTVNNNTTSNDNTSSNTNTNNNNSSSTDSNNNIQETHTHEAEVLEAVAPTCEEDGLTQGSKCSICGAILEKQEVIPKLEHSYGTDGKCIRCGAPSPDESKEIKLPKIKIK